MKCLQPDVDKFLIDMRIALEANKMQLIPRPKNLDTLARKGWCWRDVKEGLYDLSYSDYICGPDVDRDDPQSDMFWKFKARIDNAFIYIKLKILYQEDGSVRTVSFHIDGF